MFDSALLADITRGKVFSNWQITEFAFDTRKLKKGQLFIAIVGDLRDGHDFVSNALQQGAYAMVSTIPDGCDTEKLLVVEDTLKSLQEIANYYRKHVDPKMIAVTGSLGKTSTKEMMYLMAKSVAKTHMSSGNYNNYLGVPLSILSMPEDVEIGIFEVGMNHVGEISPLSHIISPDVAVITTVDAVHLEHFDSVDDIAKAKAEIFEGVGPGGAIVLNEDNRYFSLLESLAKKRPSVEIITFGESNSADVRLINHTFKNGTADVNIAIRGENIQYQLPVLSKAQIVNSLAALTALMALGYDPKLISRSLSQFQLVSGRGKLIEIEFHDKQLTIIDDCYNASPSSMKAAIEVLSGFNQKGTTLAILGDMLELGEKAEEFHRKLADTLEKNAIDYVICIGPLMRSLYDALPPAKQLGYYPQYDKAREHLDPLLIKADTILIKGSNSMGLEQLVRYMS